MFETFLIVVFESLNCPHYEKMDLKICIISERYRTIKCHPIISLDLRATISCPTCLSMYVVV